MREQRDATMKIKNLVLVGSGLMLLAASICAAQSLGDLARAERERRNKEAKKPVKEFTNDNLPTRPPSEGPTAASGISAAPSTEASTKPEAGQPAAESTSGESPKDTQAKPTEESKKEKPEDKIKTKDYWQSKFRAQRAALAKAQEEQDLVEDELRLLQIRQARELAQDVQMEVAQKITAKTADLDAKRESTAKAQKALDDLDKEFADSGAPEDWSKTE